MPNFGKVIELFQGSKLTVKASTLLIIDGDFKCITDPASICSFQELALALKFHNLQISDINSVFFTHLHFDHFNVADWMESTQIFVPSIEWEFYSELQKHTSSKEVFLEFLLSTHELVAKLFQRQFWQVINSNQYSIPEKIKRKIKFVSANQKLSDNVSTIDLSGHSPGQLGLMVNSINGNSLVCGDAILSKLDFNEQVNHLIMWNSNHYNQSRLKAKKANIIYPGHGAPFTFSKKEINYA